MHRLGAAIPAIGRDAGAQRLDGADGERLRDLHPHAVMVRPARRILTHVLELLRWRNLAAGRLAQAPERDGQQPRFRAGPMLDAGELRRGEVAVGRPQVVEEIEDLRHAGDLA